MPLYRYECGGCGAEIVDLQKVDDSAPLHCGTPMRKIMPRRVVGRVVPDSNGVHAGSGMSSTSKAEHLQAKAMEEHAWDVERELEGKGIHVEGEGVEIGHPTGGLEIPEIDPNDPNVIPPAPTTGTWAKDYSDCDAEEKTERWMDTREALATWTARKLEEKGSTPSEARKEANKAANDTITKAAEQHTGT